MVRHSDSAPEAATREVDRDPSSLLAPFFVLRQDKDSEADFDADESLNGRPVFVPRQ